MTILNRKLTIDRDERGEFIDLEPDPRHAQMVAEEAGCGHQLKAVTTPREKQKDEVIRQSMKSSTLDSSRATRFRSAVMRCNYLSQDRMDLCFAAKELSRHMSNPSEDDWNDLKRVARYLAGKPRVVQVFKRQKY